MLLCQCCSGKKAGGTAGMTDPMYAPITEKCVDHSTVDDFSFGFVCSICSKEWISERYRFNPGSIALPLDPEVFQILWNDQHKAAFARANRDAIFQFNRCTLCCQRVCKCCFHLSETGLSDICKNCFAQQSSQFDRPNIVDERQMSER